MISFILPPGKIPWVKAKIFFAWVGQFLCIFKVWCHYYSGQHLRSSQLIWLLCKQHSLLCVVRCQQLCYWCWVAMSLTNNYISYYFKLETILPWYSFGTFLHCTLNLFFFLSCILRNEHLFLFVITWVLCYILL